MQITKRYWRCFKNLWKKKAEAKKSVVKSGQGKKAEDANTNNAITYNNIKPLLEKYTCTACHATDKRQVGPSFIEIAKRGYSVGETVGLIYKPQPENWPDYATPMAPMAHVPKTDVEKIAQWIKLLENKDTR